VVVTTVEGKLGVDFSITVVVSAKVWKVWEFCFN